MGVQAQIFPASISLHRHSDSNLEAVREETMLRRNLSIAVLLLSSCFAFAQNSPDRGASRPAFEVSGGFALAGGGTLGTNFGFNAGFDARAHGPLYIAAETTYLRHPSEPSNGSADTAILAGPSYRWGGAKAVFADFLSGADVFHNSGQFYTYIYNNATNFAFAADAGADLPLGHRLAIRPMGGFFWTRLTNSTYSGPVNPAHTSSNRGRFAIDVAYRF
jgi:hypothetical protein